jgi:hypothetical protein
METTMGRPPIGKVAMTGAERVRRYRHKHGTDKLVTKPAPPVTKPTGPDHDALVQELAQAKQELAAAKARIVELEKAGAVAAAEIAALKAELHDVVVGARFAPKRREPAKPKVEKPPLPPDEARDRQIKGLKTANKNMRAELHHLREWCRTTGIPERGGMSFNIHGRIFKPLHPDHRKHLTRAELDAALDEACKMFTAWGDSLKAARSR